MAAVAKAATHRERGDIGKGSAHTVRAGPQLQLAEAGRINEQPGAGREEQLAAHGGVAAAAIGGAYLLDALLVAPQKAVDDCGFARARGTGERGGQAGLEMGSEGRETPAFTSADHENRGA